MTAPFCIIGTPRSRTAWFSRFLTHGGVTCIHEPSAYWSDNKDLDFFRPGYGAADSMLTLKWRELIDRGVNLVAVSRPRNEIVASNAAAGIPMTAGAHKLLDRVMETIAELPLAVPRYSFADLNGKAADIFERLLGRRCPLAWIGVWRHCKITADFSETLRIAYANVGGFKQFYLKDF